MGLHTSGLPSPHIQTAASGYARAYSSDSSTTILPTHHTLSPTGLDKHGARRPPTSEFLTPGHLALRNKLVEHKYTMDGQVLELQSFLLPHVYRPHLGRLFGPSGAILKKLTAHYKVHLQGLPTRSTAVADAYLLSATGTPSSNFDGFFHDLLELLETPPKQLKGSLQLLLESIKGIVPEPTDSVTPPPAETAEVHIEDIAQSPVQSTVCTKGVVVNRWMNGQVLLASQTTTCRLIFPNDLHVYDVGDSISVTGPFHWVANPTTISASNSSNTSSTASVSNVDASELPVLRVTEAVHEPRTDPVTTDVCLVALLRYTTMDGDTKLLLHRYSDSYAGLQLYKNIRAVYKVAHRRSRNFQHVSAAQERCYQLIHVCWNAFTIAEQNSLLEHGTLSSCELSSDLDLEFLQFHQSLRDYARQVLRVLSLAQPKCRPKPTDNQRWAVPSGFRGYWHQQERLETMSEAAQRIVEGLYGAKVLDKCRVHVHDPVVSAAVSEQLLLNARVVSLDLGQLSEAEATAWVDELSQTVRPREILEYAWVTPSELAVPPPNNEQTGRGETHVKLPATDVLSYAALRPMRTMRRFEGVWRPTSSVDQTSALVNWLQQHLISQ